MSVFKLLNCFESYHSMIQANYDATTTCYKEFETSQRLIKTKCNALSFIVCTKDKIVQIVSQ